MMLEVIVYSFLFTHHPVHVCVCPVCFSVLSLQCFLWLLCMCELHTHRANKSVIKMDVGRKLVNLKRMVKQQISY